MEPEITYDSNVRQLNNSLPKLLQLLEQNGIIQKKKDKIFRILSEDLFFNLGYILFLLHIGGRINFKKKVGHFYFATAKNTKEILILKNVLDNSSDFWLFYKNHPLYFQETFLFHSVSEEVYKTIIYNHSDINTLEKFSKKLMN